MNPLQCVGYEPTLSLMRRLSESGYSAPWELTDAEFENFVQALPKGAREEFDRIDRALHAGSDVSEMMKYHPEVVRKYDTLLWMRLKGIGPEDNLFVYKVLEPHETTIRPGDVAELSEREVRGRSLKDKETVSMTVKAKDVDWIDGKWIYSPYLCRNHDASVHDFLVGYAIQSGAIVPERVLQEYLLR
ncbi:MAG: hypothetical protein MN733_38470 [Nitrososphaera sp.]|nr:hypothetical protein [Nitrososphaera sp.]